MSEKTKFRFSQRTLAGVTCPTDKTKIRVRDTEVPGLTLLVTRGGSRVFYHYKKINGKPSEYRIGSEAELTVEQARAIAAEKNNGIALGIDPQAEKRAARRQQATLGELWQSYLDGHLSQHKAKNVDWYQRRYDRHLVVWKDRMIKDITPQDVEALKLRTSKYGLPEILFNYTVDIHHTVAYATGYLINQVNPRVDMATHLAFDNDTMNEQSADIRAHWKGLFVYGAPDVVVVNVTKDAVWHREAALPGFSGASMPSPTLLFGDPRRAAGGTHTVDADGIRYARRPIRQSSSQS
jgi:Arm DNA-binding domain